jgi:hypothetical protein
MLDFVLRVIQSFGFWVGLLFVGGALVIGCTKISEHSSYIPVEATVVAVSTKCNMSYRTGRRSRHERTVDCGDVAGVKARTPEVDWTVDRVTFVDLAFQAETGQTVTKSVRLGTLERTTAAPGEKVPILRSRDTNNLITSPTSASFLRNWGMMFIIGAALLGMSLWIRRLRNPRPASAMPERDYATAARELDVATPPPPPERGRNARPSFGAAAGGHFGRRAPTVDYVRRG